MATQNGDKHFVDENGVVGAGKHLNLYEVHKLVEERGDEVVFFDGRNAFEAKIGKGKVYVYGPEITFRGQTHSTYKMLFNQLYK